ncbi:hypothetical protein Ahy_B10g104825 [Arachis hypogaea]|uniref:Protein kinase domain-containing protein n=1 Tax=Arachis hypogaea TaxID=3818 RepID=A0A444X6W1_ARAHY|nr:hypothetical protein Ahy_B10g104825 [Arachis hypogaea]
MLTLSSDPNVVQLKKVYEDDENVYIVIEHYEDNELCDRIIIRGYYNECIAAKVFQKIVKKATPNARSRAGDGAAILIHGEGGLIDGEGRGNGEPDGGAANYAARSASTSSPKDHRHDGIWEEEHQLAKPSMATREEPVRSIDGDNESDDHR